MTAEAYNKWDLLLKAFGAIGLVATACFGLGEYYVNWSQTNTLETNTFDSEQHKLYFDKQLEYYLNVTATVATIASTHDKRKREDLIQKFDAFYYGPMVILEHRGDSADPSKHQVGEKYALDANVEQHMIAVHKCLAANCTDGELQEQSLALADACRSALALDWAGRVKNLKTGLDLKGRIEQKDEK